MLPSLLLIVQSVDVFFAGYLSDVRGMVLLILTIGLYMKFGRKSKSPLKPYIYIFLIYNFIISFKSSNYGITFPGYLSIFVSTSFFLFSYNTFSTYFDVVKLGKMIYIVPIIFIANVLIYSVFPYKGPVYGGEGVLNTGPGLHHNTIYVSVLILTLALVFLKYSKNVFRDVSLVSSMIIIVLLSFRRTALILMAICLIIYLVMASKQLAIKYLGIFTVLIILVYPFYSMQLVNVIEARGNKATFSSGLDSESRYLEAKVITKKILSSRNLGYILTGKEYLNSFGTYYSNEFPVPKTRILHTDYAVILHGSGAIGLIIYFTMLMSFLWQTLKYIRILGPKHDISILCSCFVAILFLVTFSGSILNITFRTTLFILLGAVMRLGDEIEKIGFNKALQSMPL